MNPWETAIKKLNKNDWMHRYDIRPGLSGPIVFCSTCARSITEEMETVVLAIIVMEANMHEETNHGHKPATGSHQEARAIA